jgi:hypothetical protein
LTRKKNIRSASRNNAVTKSLQNLTDIGRKKGYVVSRDVDYGFGKIDLVWNINFHSGLSPLKCGFIELNYNQVNSDQKDNQSLMAISEEAIMRGIRSGLDRIYLVCPDEKIAASVNRQSSRFKSIGSFLQFNSYSSGLVAVGDTNA